MTMHVDARKFASSAQIVASLASHLTPVDSSVVIRDERASDVGAREALLDAAFGPERFAKTAEKLRSGRLPAHGLAFSALDDGALVGTLRLWDVDAGGVRALMLGPIAIADSHRSLGLGGAMIRKALARAEALRHNAVILVGDAPYYARFGFERRLAEKLEMPGWVDVNRFLALELRSGALAPAQGMVRATGRMVANVPLAA